MSRTFLVGVRGESHNNDDGASRQDIIRRMRANEPVQLRADPTNQHDRWAVKVLTQSGEQIGWLPSDARDADALLKGEPIEATVHGCAAVQPGSSGFLARNLLVSFSALPRATLIGADAHSLKIAPKK